MPTKYKYSVPDPEQLPRTGETVRYKSGLLEEDQDPVLYPETGHDTIKKILMHAYKEYADEPYLGSREKSFNDKGEVEYGKYKWETYEECINKAIWLARSIYDKELFNTASEEGRKYNLIGIYSKNNEGWAITDLACCLSNMATVTLYDTLGADSSEYIIQQTELKTVVCTADHVNALIKIKTVKGVDHLQNIVIIGEIEHDDVATIERAGMNYYSIDALIEEGKHSKTELDDPHNQDLFTIIRFGLKY